MVSDPDTTIIGYRGAGFGKTGIERQIDAAELQRLFPIDDTPLFN
jgi:hypothetical protein